MKDCIAQELIEELNGLDKEEADLFSNRSETTWADEIMIRGVCNNFKYMIGPGQWS